MKNLMRMRVVGLALLQDGNEIDFMHTFRSWVPSISGAKLFERSLE
jgi:hypothetical protein